ncbi:hypothetical protein ACFONC_14250 [Luteimonas soli]|uniref:Uncharacterized protein n=1 Tax=Luteimonas soli TaxID=1648966 RepID=A0ABV7XQD7_9GAMM
MPYFKVILAGSGINLIFEDVPVAGFFTTRLVRADSLASAEHLAKELVLCEWRSGGAYAKDNQGSVPTLAVEQSFSAGWFAGTFGRKPFGYTFYRRED